MDEVIRRWSAFLEKIERAYDGLLAEGCVGCLALAGTRGTAAMSNAWHGVRAEVFALSDRIERAWHEQVEASFTAAGVEGEALQREEERGRGLGQRMRHGLERREIELFGEVAEHLLADAREEARERVFACTRCGARLQLPASIFSSVHVCCEYCRAVTTFEPGTRARLVEHFCAHHLGQRAALDQWEALEAAHRLRRQTRGESPEVLEQIAAAKRAYWQAYFSARAQLVPASKERIDLEVAARLR
jgi:hypothetical protein